MARRAPKPDAQFLLKARLLIKRWQEQGPSTLGLDPARVDALEQLIEQAEAAGTEYRRLRRAALSANGVRRTAMKRARSAFGALITAVDAQAKYTGDEGVYARAFIRPPAAPAPRPIPSAPQAGGAALRSGGPIEVRFKGKGDGLLYEIQRQVLALDNTLGPWETVAPAVGKTWIDRCPPSGVLEVRYRARAMRPGRKGPFGPARVSAWSGAVAATFGCGAAEGVVELAPGKAA